MFDGSSPTSIHRILASARRFNAQAGIACALLAYGGCFLQVLEGPADAVQTTFVRSCKDPRHTEVSAPPLACAANGALRGGACATSKSHTIPTARRATFWTDY
jgi:hypothetical protein